MHEASQLVRKQELINYLLLRIPLKECAARLQLSYATVRKYASTPEFLGELSLLSKSVYADVVEELKYDRKSIKDRMTEASDKALTRLEQLLESAQEGIALKAADSILDRNAESARNRKVEGDFSNRFSMDPMMLMHAAKTAEEIGFTPDASKEENK
jgi:hypothetical protein